VVAGSNPCQPDTRKPALTSVGVGFVVSRSGRRIAASLPRICRALVSGRSTESPWTSSEDHRNDTMIALAGHAGGMNRLLSADLGLRYGFHPTGIQLLQPGWTGPDRLRKTVVGPGGPGMAEIALRCGR
jgi:hypothetical protein